MRIFVLAAAAATCRRPAKLAQVSGAERPLDPSRGPKNGPQATRWLLINSSALRRRRRRRCRLINLLRSLSIMQSALALVPTLTFAFAFTYASASTSAFTFALTFAFTFTFTSTAASTAASQQLRLLRPPPLQLWNASVAREVNWNQFTGFLRAQTLFSALHFSWPFA